MTANFSKTMVFYDGLCILCSREINHYRRAKGSHLIDFVDINGVDFDPNSFGLDPFEVHKVMHARKPDGTIVTRVDAFIQIWDTLPNYRWMGRLARLTPVKTIMEVFYTCFARIRPYLPRRKADLNACKGSPYCDIDSQKK